MNREELYARARKEVERRRQTAEVQAMRRRDEIYAKAPELLELDRHIGEAGTMAARLAADGQGDAAREKLQELRHFEDEKGYLLQRLGGSAYILQPEYQCSQCHDTGRSGGSVCTCIHQLVRRFRSEEINKSGAFGHCTFATFSLDKYPENIEGLSISPRLLMQNHVEDCKYYAEHFSLQSDSQYMYGDAGLGKTHLALSIAQVVLQKGFDVVYVSAQNAFARISADHRDWNAGDEYFRSLLNADLLILDDLGTEYLDAYTRSKLYELVNTRMNRRPTIYTTNIQRQDLLHQRYTEKIASRLLGECHPMRFFGLDIRLQKDPYVIDE